MPARGMCQRYCLLAGVHAVISGKWGCKAWKSLLLFFFFSLHLHSGTSLGQSLEKADNDKCCSWIVAPLYTVRSKILSPLLTLGNFLLMMLWADTSVCSLVSMNPAFLLHGFLKSAWEWCPSCCLSSQGSLRRSWWYFTVHHLKQCS